MWKGVARSLTFHKIEKKRKEKKNGKTHTCERKQKERKTRTYRKREESTTISF